MRNVGTHWLKGFCGLTFIFIATSRFCFCSCSMNQFPSFTSSCTFLSVLFSFVYEFCDYLLFLKYTENRSEYYLRQFHPLYSYVAESTLFSTLSGYLVRLRRFILGSTSSSNGCCYEGVKGMNGKMAMFSTSVKHSRLFTTINNFLAQMVFRRPVRAYMPIWNLICILKAFGAWENVYSPFKDKSKVVVPINGWGTVSSCHEWSEKNHPHH